MEAIPIEGHEALVCKRQAQTGDPGRIGKPLGSNAVAKDLRDLADRLRRDLSKSSAGTARIILGLARVDSVAQRE